MQALSLFFAVFIFIKLISVKNQDNADAIIELGRNATIAGNMLVYHHAILDYAVTHPAATGEVRNTVLKLPAWFNYDPKIKNFISNGKSYVYCINPEPGLIVDLFIKSHGSLLTGIKYRGGLYNTFSGILSIYLPEVIPDNSVVYAGGG